MRESRTTSSPAYLPRYPSSLTTCGRSMRVLGFPSWSLPIADHFPMSTATQRLWLSSGNRLLTGVCAQVTNTDI